MRLFIHFGIYKAGSSYLQYVSANSRAFLLDQGIYFPKSIHDPRMIRGEISPGNADGIEMALKKGNQKKLTTILEDYFRDAQKANAHTVLISSEALVHQLAEEDKINLLKNSSDDAGFKSIHLMGFFRDLADHALSTYKHRAKSGKIPDYEYWLEQVYETPDVLYRLAKVRAQHPDLDWTFRKFRKESQFLRQAFFRGWMNINEPDFAGRPKVNESMTLSEIKVMYQIRILYPHLTDFFIKAFKNLDGSKKADDAPLEEVFLSKAQEIFQKKDIDLALLNQYMPQEETLIVGNFKPIEGSGLALYSDHQLNTLIQTIRAAESWSGKMVRFRRKLIQYIPVKFMRVKMRRKP